MLDRYGVDWGSRIGLELDSVSQQLMSPAGEPKTSLGQKELPSQFTMVKVEAALASPGYSF